MPAMAAVLKAPRPVVHLAGAANTPQAGAGGVSPQGPTPVAAVMEVDPADESLAVLPKAFKETEKTLREPRALRQDWKAEEVASKYLTKSTGDNKDDIVAEIQDSKTILSLEGSKTMAGHDFVSVRQRVAQLEKKLEKATNATPGAAVSHAELVWARDGYNGRT